MRAFVAIELGEPLRTAAAEWLGRTPRLAGVRWVRPANLHITLKFLGQIAESALPALGAALGVCARDTQPFDLSSESLGVFPERGPARVLWWGMRDSGAGAALAARLDSAVESFGVPRESRPLVAHVTLARAQRAIAGWRLRELAEESAPPSGGTFRVDRVVLMESRPASGGPDYVALACEALGGRAAH